MNRLPRPVRVWVIAVQQVDNLEVPFGRQLYRGTELGAYRAACRLAREEGRGWLPWFAVADPLRVVRAVTP